MAMIHGTVKTWFVVKANEAGFMLAGMVYNNSSYSNQESKLDDAKTVHRE